MKGVAEEMTLRNRPRAIRPRVAIAIVALSTIAYGAMATVAAQATSGYKSQFNQKYDTSGTKLDTCKTCHSTANDAEHLNVYGLDFENGHDFAAIESKDSDGDQATNIEEINARSFPGDPSDKPAPAPSPTPDEGLASSLPRLEDVLRDATTGLPVLGGTFGGDRGGFVPAPYSDELGEQVESVSKGTTESCTKCHPEKKGSNHYFNVTPNGTADCWLCHSKHIACTLCHRVGAGESVGHVGAERVNAFTGQDASPVTDQVDAAILEYAPEVNYAVADGGLILKDMPGDASGVAGILMPLMEGNGSPPPLKKTIWRLDNTVHDPRFTARAEQAAGQ